MIGKKETAEEKLLKIIEGTKKAQGAGSSGAALSLPPRGSHRFSVTVQHINFLLLAAVIASFLFLGYEITRGMSLLEEEVDISVDAVGARGVPNVFSPKTRDMAYYLELISSRNIFKPYEKITISPETSTAQAAFERKMSKYKIVGIAWLDTPESATVMLEDTSTRMTHFLRENEKIEDVTVKTIYTDRVVVSYANEEMVIKL